MTILDSLAIANEDGGYCQI